MLRSTLRLEEEDGGERRHALAVLALSRQEATRAGILGYGAGIKVLAVSVWLLSGQAGEGASASVAALRPVVATLPANPGAEAHAAPEVLAQPLPREQANKSRTAVAAQEHPYWQAVRAARQSIARYRVDESSESAALRERMNAAILTAPPAAGPVRTEYKGNNGSPRSRSALLMAPAKPIPPLSTRRSG